ncbi:MAG: DinB family protein [Candidatus Methanofastidiosia archaeon]
MFEHWKEVRKALLEGVENLSQEQLDWKAENAVNSVGDLLRHIADTLDWWFSEEIKDGGKFIELTQENCGDLERILKELNRSFERLIRYVEKNRDFDVVFESSWGGKFTLNWALWHLFEHEVHHRGQIFMMLRMMGVELPQI